MGARESWGLETSAQSYFYVLTGEKVPVEHSDEELERVRATVARSPAESSSSDFEPTPSPEICSSATTGSSARQPRSSCGPPAVVDHPDASVVCDRGPA